MGLRCKKCHGLHSHSSAPTLRVSLAVRTVLQNRPMTPSPIWAVGFIRVNLTKRFRYPLMFMQGKKPGESGIVRLRQPESLAFADSRIFSCIWVMRTRMTRVARLTTTSQQSKITLMHSCSTYVLNILGDEDLHYSDTNETAHLIKSPIHPNLFRLTH